MTQRARRSNPNASMSRKASTPVIIITIGESPSPSPYSSSSVKVCADWAHSSEANRTYHHDNEVAGINPQIVEPDSVRHAIGCAALTFIWTHPAILLILTIQLVSTLLSFKGKPAFSLHTLNQPNGDRTEICLWLVLFAQYFDTDITGCQ